MMLMLRRMRRSLSSERIEVEASEAFARRTEQRCACPAAAAGADAEMGAAVMGARGGRRFGIGLRLLQIAEALERRWRRGVLYERQRVQVRV